MPRTTQMLSLLTLIASSAVHAQPTAQSLTTRWTSEVSTESPHAEHPRPTMVRDRWLSLNGTWNWADASGQESHPPATGVNRRVLVPFAFESSLSGVGRQVERAWCTRRFDVPDSWATDRVLLHFGAVDWRAEVWINGQPVGSHEGGYDPFSFDITEHLRAGQQEIAVRVWDPTDAGTQPRGKQAREPRGIWYTPVSGIWQSVWLEAVPETAIERLEITPDFDTGLVSVTVHAPGAGPDATVLLSAIDPTTDERISLTIGRANQPETIDLSHEFRAWSPEDPFLYGLVAALTHTDGRRGDTVRSYFGIRKIEVRADSHGVQRIHLNGEPRFLLATLDQGYWPDGLYTAPTDGALRYDLEVTKRLGFNAVRKHVKVEPERWYRLCDELGLLVIQDMPNGDAHIGADDADLERTPESAAQFELELTRVIAANHNHPSIIMWVPFNEGWGQFDTGRIASLVRELDPTRLVDCASGWADRPFGDVIDWHAYPGPASPDPTSSRAAFLGEFGGLGLPVDGHLWQTRDNWGYRTLQSADELTDAYVDLIDRTRWLMSEPGLSGAVYTQITDVEGEVNGLMTYDRAVLKIDEQRAIEAHRRLLGPAQDVRPIAPDARFESVEWRYTLEDPGEGWAEPGFDDSGWQTGRGGFGTEGTPGAVIGTTWESEQIWIRRTFVLPRIAIADPHLVVHHDEDAAIFINGVQAASLGGYTAAYRHLRPSEDARAALIGGPTVIAAHCVQTAGGQYIDVGLVDVVNR